MLGLRFDNFKNFQSTIKKQPRINKITSSLRQTLNMFLKISNSHMTEKHEKGQHAVFKKNKLTT